MIVESTQKKFVKNSQLMSSKVFFGFVSPQIDLAAFKWPSLFRPLSEVGRSTSFDFFFRTGSALHSQSGLCSTEQTKINEELARC